MATTKKIPELTAAASVGADDKIPVAQPARGEAVAVTISQVAAAVAALNEEGALSELALATSVGKNLLAQRLTEKGVPTTANETLSQMADKVGGLVVQDSVDVLKGPVYYDYSSINIPGQYTPHVMRTLGNGDKIFWANNHVYYIPDGNYSTFEEFINAATCAIDAPEISGSKGFSLDKNDEYFALFTDDTHVRVYKVDKTAKNITLEQTAELVTACAVNSGYKTCAVIGGKWLVYSVKPSNSFLWCAFNLETSEEFLSSIYGGYVHDILVVQNTPLSGSIVNTLSIGSSNNSIYQIDYSIVGNTWTWGTLKKIATLAPSLVCNRMEKLINVTYSSKSNTNLRLVILQIYSPENLLLAEYKQKILVVGNSDYRFLYLQNPRVWEENNKWKIEIHPFWPPFTYDPANNAITFDGPEDFVPLEYQTGNNYGGYRLFQNKLKGTLAEYHGNYIMEGTTVSVSSLHKIQYTTDKKVTGFKRVSPDGKEFYYPGGYVKADDVESGAMDVTTKNLPLPGAEEEEEANQ